MNVRQLKNELDGIDDETLVVLSSDEEGNYYSPLFSLHKNTYKNHEVGLEKLTPELEAKGYTEEDILEGKSAIVLYP